MRRPAKKRSLIFRETNQRSVLCRYEKRNLVNYQPRIKRGQLATNHLVLLTNVLGERLSTFVFIEITTFHIDSMVFNSQGLHAMSSTIGSLECMGSNFHAPRGICRFNGVCGPHGHCMVHGQPRIIHNTLPDFLVLS